MLLNECTGVHTCFVQIDDKPLENKLFQQGSVICIGTTSSKFYGRNLELADYYDVVISVRTRLFARSFRLSTAPFQSQKKCEKQYSYDLFCAHDKASVQSKHLRFNNKNKQCIYTETFTTVIG